MTAMEKAEMGALQVALEKATAAYSSATRRAESAHADARGALNDLNKAQRAFDHAVSAIASKAPTESDWAAKRRPRS